MKKGTPFDAIVCVGLAGFILWKWPQISAWSNSVARPNVAQTCLSQQFSNINLTAATILFGLVVAFSYMTLTGRESLLRASGFAAFIAVWLDVFFFEVIGLSHPQIAFSAFWNAVGQFQWLIVFYGVGGILAVMAFLSVIDTFINGRTDWISEFLLTLKMFSFMLVAIAATYALRWEDLSYISVAGTIAAMGEAGIEGKREMEEQGCGVSIEVAIGSLVCIVIFAVVGISGFQIFLAPWNPAFC